MTYSPIRPAAVDGSAGFRRSCSTRFSAAAAAAFGCCATTGRHRQSTMARLSRLALTLSHFIATPDLLLREGGSARSLFTAFLRPRKGSGADKPNRLPTPLSLPISQIGSRPPYPCRDPLIPATRPP